MKTVGLTSALVAITLLAVPHAFSDSGIWGTYIEINNKGTKTAYTQTNPNGGGPATFDGQSFGAFTSTDTFQISGAEVLTFKNGGSDVTGASLFYNVHLSSGSAPGHTEEGISFYKNEWEGNALFDDQNLSGSGNQSWAENTSAINLLSLVSGTGTYDLEIYWKASTSDGDKFDNDGGANFTATFSYTAPTGGGGAVPEPGSLGLMAIAGVVITLLRRKVQTA